MQLVDKSVGTQGNMTLDGVNLEKDFGTFQRKMTMTPLIWHGAPEKFKMEEAMYENAKG